MTQIDEKVKSEVIEKSKAAGLDLEVAVAIRSEGAQLQANLRRLVEMCMDIRESNNFSNEVCMALEPLRKIELPIGDLYIGRRPHKKPHITWKNLILMFQNRDEGHVKTVLSTLVIFDGELLETKGDKDIKNDLTLHEDMLEYICKLYDLEGKAI